MAEAKRRHSVIMVGLGGQGVLLAGDLLARAAMSQYEHVLWFPLYTVFMRGAPSECTVILSDQSIPCQIISQADTLLAMESSQLKPFESRVKPGGNIIVEKTGLTAEVERDDVRMWTIPALETTLAIGGDTQASNLVMLGAYLAIAKVIPPETVQREIEIKFSGKGKSLSLNMEAFKKGLDIVTNQ